MKKIFTVSLALLFFTLFFLGVYNFAFKKNDSEDAIKTGKGKINTAAKTVSENGKSKITQISKDGVIGAVSDKKTEKIFYYSSTDGTLWQVDADGSDKAQVSETKLNGLQSVAWSPDRKKVITLFDRNGKNVFYQYNHEKMQGFQLKDGLDTAVWDNIGAKIIYKYYDVQTGKRSLNVANPDGSDWRIIMEDIPFRSVSVAQVPSTSLVSFWNSPSAREETWFQTVGVSGGQSQTILKGRFGADYLWAPDGSKALVSSLPKSDARMVFLGIIDLEGKYSDLNVPTLVSKCVWSSDSKTVYYALPGGIVEDSVMPDDYQNKKFTTEDTFWKMNIETGLKQRILETGELDGTYDSNELFLSSTEDALFFVNRKDGKLYRLEL